MRSRRTFVGKRSISRKFGRVLAVLVSTVLFTAVVGVSPAFAAVPTWPSGQYMGVLRNVPFTIPVKVSAGTPLTAMSVVTAPANTTGFGLANINLAAGTADMVGTYTAAPSGATVTAALRATNASGNSSNSSFALEAYTCSWASPAGTTTTLFDANQASYVTGVQAGYNQPVTNGVAPGTQLSPTCADLDVPGLGASTLTVSNPFSGTISPQNNDNDSSESDMNAGCGIVSILGTKTGTYSGSTCNGHSTVPNPWANGGTLSLSIGSQSDKGDTNTALTNCPPSQAAVNAGLITCTDTGSTGSSSYSWNFTEDQFLYNGQNLPQQPTAALSASTVLAGSSINISSATNWWGNASGAPVAGTGHTQSGSYYSVPAPSVFIGTSRGTAVPATSSLQVSPTAYACGQASSSVPPNPCTFTPGTLSGSFTVPNSLTPGTYHVYIDEANTSPLFGNGPNDSYQTARGTNLGTAESDTTITVGTAPSITSAATTTFTTGSAGSFNVTTSGSPTPTLSKSGALPSGVTFTDNGNGTATIAGTPASGTGGVYPITITAANGLGANATQSFSLVVNQPPAITSANNTMFSVGTAGSFVVTTSGYPPPALSEIGALPSGVTFTDNGNGTATIAGTPDPGTAADYPLAITATNGVGSDANQAFTLVVNQAPAITSPASATFTTGVTGTATITSTARPVAALTEVGALPAGVSFVDNGDGTATLSGTPGTLTGGVYNLAITAHNGIGSDAHQAFALTVDDAPAVTSGSSTTFTTGSAGSFGVTTTGYPAPALSEVGALPSGVTFVDNGDGTATLSGTPDPLTGGVYSLAITASNGVGSDAHQTLTLTVNDAPAITSGSSTTFTTGSAGSFSVTTTGYPTPGLSETGALPSGVSFVDNGDGTATLAGTAAPGSGGVYPLAITATNGIGADAHQTLTLTVNDAPAITSANNVEFAESSADTFTVTTTGYPAPGLSETGALPTGVTFVDNGDGTATLAGTPASGTAGPYTLSITATNGVGSDAHQTFSLTVISAPVITSAASTAFEVGTAGTFAVTATGVPTPSLTQTGALPSGVTFVDNGDGTATLSGTPAVGTGGVYPLSITAANGVGTNGHQAFTLTVNEGPVITSGASTTMTVGGPQSFVVTTTGQPAPALSETGALPSGITFVDNGDGTATLSGTPDPGTGAVYHLAITATNGFGSDAHQAFTLNVNEAPAITSAAATTFTVGSAGSFSVTSAANPASALSETGALPSGVTFVDNGNGSATLAGTPDTGTGGLYQITITASNGVGTDAHQSFTLTVDEAPSITSTASTTFTTGSAGSFTVTTGGYPAPALSKTGGLPSGVTFVDNGDGTATLSGTPDAGTGGVYPLAITATNGIGADAHQSFTLTVNQASAITSAATTTFVVGSAGTFTVTATGHPTPSLSRSGALPAGVTFVDNGNGTATLAGTPASGTAGDYPLTFTASNGVGPDVPQSFTLRIGQPATITSANSAVFIVGHASSFTVTTTGFPAPGIVEAGGLPAGVHFHDNGNGTATLSGTPTGVGVYSITFTADNGIGSSVSQSFTLTDGKVSAFTSAASVHFSVGVPGSFTIKTTGYPTPAITKSGALPSGVTYTDNGDGTATLAGTPGNRAAGSYPLSLTATNGVGSPAHQAFTLTVNTVSAVSVGDASMPEGDTYHDRFMMVPVSLSKPSASPVTVMFRLRGITATGGKLPGRAIDFIDMGGSATKLTFPAGSTLQTVGVNIVHDQTVEPNETLSVTLSSPTGGYILGRSVGTGTILNDDIDPLQRIGIGDTSIVEGNAGARNVTLRLSLSKPLTFPVSVHWTATGVTATYGATSSVAGADWGGPKSGIVTFPAASVVGSINIPIYGDARIEPNETIHVTLSSPTPGAALGRSVGTATILNDD